LPRHAGLLADARKRISAIKQYSTLGSGFKIALRDLEIRGAGNLLGPQQSGHISAVGFELYCQLLQQSIRSLKGEQVKPRVEVEARLDFLDYRGQGGGGSGRESGVRGQGSGVKGRSVELEIRVPRETALYVESDEVAQSKIQNPKSNITRASASIPLNYISDSRQRIEVLSQAGGNHRRRGFGEIAPGNCAIDFGPLPPPVELLLELSLLKVLASEKGISGIETKEDKLMLMRNNDYVMLGGKFPRLTKNAPKARLGEIRRFMRAL